MIESSGGTGGWIYGREGEDFGLRCEMGPMVEEGREEEQKGVMNILSN